jgi:hypothetical protein
MSNKWTITKLIVIGSLAIIDLALGLSGSVIQTVVGVPGAAGIVMQLVGPMMLVFCSLLIQQFGAATLMLFVFHICALPLPMSGPPGFLPKILIGLIAGLITDTLYLLLKKQEKIAAGVIGAVNPPIFLFLIFGLGKLFSVPGVDDLAEVLSSPISIVVMLAVGALGGYIALFVFNRLKNTAIVARIQGA